ncbi:wax ester/triacylglycerol synthase domain-containing protein [Nocardia gipuzkoensis]|uniref:wax ester/triacylglycerol synthase domain-containing protein n=1 Tax=Nocardia gipuzkoensis TaxID=2749991 RepID=UPI00237E19AF|nr:wax ester/triacylglycerol synthase domain-containing protein [Nocardia gipuzkoensis]MDE1673902.1 wax ester/triacylglycerol synthase family O-acyltransferase [Nocardia gipuzkoensis]
MDLRESHMSQSDLFSWNMERDPVLRSTIVSVLVLDTEPDWERLLRTMDRGTRLVPRLRHRLADSLLGLAPPRWALDPDFDLSWHVRRSALPAPANMSAVLEFARTEAMTGFDPVRPLWRATLLSGSAGGGCALVLTVHHSLTDGIGGIQIATSLLDFDRAGTDHGHPPEPRGDRTSALRDIMAWNWSVGSGLLRDGVRSTPPTVWRALSNPARAVRDSGALASSLVRLARPITTTMSPVMTGRSLGRRLAVLDVPLERLRGAARATGCTLNDAFLTAVVIGLRTYHDRHGATIDQLRVTMPISLRRAEDPLGGNRITLARFALPVGGGETTDLMRAVGAAVAGWRREPAIPLSGAIAAALNRLPAGLLTEMLKHVDFVASNVPGSPVPLYIAGARIDRMYAFAPTIGTALNVTLTSHAGTCYVGINADTAAIPDMETLTECLTAGFATVLGLNGGLAPESGAESSEEASRSTPM